MKNKFITVALTLICALSLALGLAACDTGSVATIDRFYATDGVNNDYNGMTTYTLSAEYGETIDLTKYKLFLHYTNGDTKEVSRTDEKLAVKYYYAPPLSNNTKQEITALPGDKITGDYYVEYVYDGNTELKAEVLVCVFKAQTGNFTVQPIGTTWQSQGALHKVIVKNPKGAEVKKEWVDIGDGGSTIKSPENTNDTDGDHTLYLFEKSVYEGFTDAQKKDHDFLYEYWSNDNNNDEHKVYIYDPEFSEVVGVPEGEYMLLALISETYNYDKIVTPAVQITVTAPPAQQ